MVKKNQKMLLKNILKISVMCLGLYPLSVLAQANDFILDSKIIPKSERETYSDLVILPKLHPTTNFKIKFKFKVLKQYRKTPNPWESFWLFWSYNLGFDSNKKTNYLAFKTNGLEIGQAYGTIDQHFVWTANQPKIEINKLYEIELESIKNNLQIKINNEVVAENITTEKLYLIPGRIGLYVEDGKVWVSSVGYHCF